jgi:hypothetical protein
MTRPPLAGGGQARTIPTPSPHNPTVAPDQDIRAERAALLRDFIGDALVPVECDVLAARLCLTNHDDVGARYHLKRMVVSVKAAALTFRELEALGAGE